MSIVTSLGVGKKPLLAACFLLFVFGVSDATARQNGSGEGVWINVTNGCTPPSQIYITKLTTVITIPPVLPRNNLYNAGHGFGGSSVWPGIYASSSYNTLYQNGKSQVGDGLLQPLLSMIQGQWTHGKDWYQAAPYYCGYYCCGGVYSSTHKCVANVVPPIPTSELLSGPGNLSIEIKRESGGYLQTLTYHKSKELTYLYNLPETLTNGVLTQQYQGLVQLDNENAPIGFPFNAAVFKNTRIYTNIANPQYCSKETFLKGTSGVLLHGVSYHSHTTPGQSYCEIKTCILNSWDALVDPAPSESVFQTLNSSTSGYVSFLYYKNPNMLSPNICSTISHVPHTSDDGAYLIMITCPLRPHQGGHWPNPDIADVNAVRLFDKAALNTYLFLFHWYSSPVAEMDSRVQTGWEVQYDKSSNTYQMHLRVGSTGSAPVAVPQGITAKYIATDANGNPCTSVLLGTSLMTSSDNGTLSLQIAPKKALNACNLPSTVFQYAVTKSVTNTQSLITLSQSTSSALPSSLIGTLFNNNPTTMTLQGSGGNTATLQLIVDPI